MHPPESIPEASRSPGRRHEAGSNPHAATGDLVSRVPTGTAVGTLDTNRTLSGRLDSQCGTGTPLVERGARISRRSALAPTPNPARFRFDLPRGDVLESTRDTGNDFVRPTRMPDCSSVLTATSGCTTDDEEGPATRFDRSASCASAGLGRRRRPGELVEKRPNVAALGSVSWHDQQLLYFFGVRRCVELHNFCA